MGILIGQWDAHSAQPPASNAAILGNYVDISSAGTAPQPDQNPNTHLPVVSFPLDTPAYIEFAGAIPPNYVAATNINVFLLWRGTSLATTLVDWLVQMKSATAVADVLTKAWAKMVAATSAGIATANFLQSLTLTFDAADELDSCAAGEYFRLRVGRDADDVTNDTYGAAADLVLVRMETV